MSHKAQALVLTCIDFRFQHAIEEFIKEEGIHKQFDKIAVAGAVKQIARPTKPEYAEYLLSQIDVSVKLHSPDCIYLINHEDCGAYGEDNARKTHTADLNKAQTIIQKIYPNITIRKFIAMLTGEVEEID